MARNELSLAKILYFCNVKNQLRHEVVGLSSVFRAIHFREKLYPNDGGNSNVRKGSAVDTLTHRIGVFICQKINCMKTEKKETNAQLEALRSIQEHLQSFASVSELWKSVAKAGAALSYAQRKCQQGELDDISDMINQFVCILEVLEPLQKGGEV